MGGGAAAVDWQQHVSLQAQVGLLLRPAILCLAA